MQVYYTDERTTYKFTDKERSAIAGFLQEYRIHARKEYESAISANKIAYNVFEQLRKYNVDYITDKQLVLFEPFMQRIGVESIVDVFNAIGEMNE